MLLELTFNVLLKMCQMDGHTHNIKTPWAPARAKIKININKVSKSIVKTWSKSKYKPLSQ